MTKQNKKFTPSFGGHRFGVDFFSGVNPGPDVIVSKLMNGTSVSVFGPRRIGKSSLLAEARECLKAKGKEVIWVDLDINDSLTKSISEIFNSMQQGKDKSLVNKIRNFAEKSEIFTPEVKLVISSIISGTFNSETESFDEKYAEVLYRETGRQLKERESGSKPIIIFDELTLMLKNAIDRSVPGEERIVVGRLNSFLGMLRHWRNLDVGIAMAVSGSASLDWLGQKYGIRTDSVNDCVPVRVKTMTRENAKKLIELCVQSRPPKYWNDKLSEELLNMLPEYYPGIIQLAYEEIVSAEEVSMKSLRGTIKNDMNFAFRKHYFSQFHKKFSNYGASERNRSKKLFEAIENQQDGIVESTEALGYLDASGQEDYELDAEELLDFLYSDFFIDIVDGGISFSSGLIPAWRRK